MKVNTVEELHREALALGAEVEFDGKRFNTDQQRVLKAVPKPQRPPEPPAPVPEPQTPPPPVVPMVTHAELQEALAQRDAAFADQMNAVVAAFKVALTSIAARPESAPPVLHWEFSVTYDKDGAITRVKADAR